MMIKLRHLVGAAIFTAAFTLTAWIDDPSHYEADQWYITYQYENGCHDLKRYNVRCFQLVKSDNIPHIDRI